MTKQEKSSKMGEYGTRYFGRSIKVSNVQTVTRIAIRRQNSLHCLAYEDSLTFGLPSEMSTIEIEHWESICCFLTAKFPNTCLIPLLYCTNDCGQDTYLEVFM
jgi:hypothetical protein